MADVLSLPNAVLVVDDEPVIIDMFRMLFADRGIEVHTATTGEEAVELLKRTGFGCLLTDKNLPGMDGMRVVEAARELQPHCASIVMTGYANTASAIEALRLGAIDYLEKPLPDVEIVAVKVERAIQTKRTELERDAFLERVRSYQHELEEQESKLAKQKTEIELFDQVLELRVRQATADIRGKYELLQQCLTKTRDADYAAQVHAEAILDEVREVMFADNEKATAIARATLARVGRKLELHVRFLEHLQRGDDPAKPPPK